MVAGHHLQKSAGERVERASRLICHAATRRVPCMLACHTPSTGLHSRSTGPPRERSPASTIDWYWLGSASRTSAFSFSLFSSSSRLSSRILGFWQAGRTTRRCGWQTPASTSQSWTQVSVASPSSGAAVAAVAAAASAALTGRAQRQRRRRRRRALCGSLTDLVLLGLHLEAGIAEGLLEGHSIHEEGVAQATALQTGGWQRAGERSEWQAWKPHKVPLPPHTREFLF